MFVAVFFMLMLDGDIQAAPFAPMLDDPKACERMIEKMGPWFAKRDGVKEVYGKCMEARPYSERKA